MDTAFTPLKIQTHVKLPSFEKKVIVSFTPIKIQARVKRYPCANRGVGSFTPIRIQAHVKLQIPLFNSESWMSLSEVHLALNE